MAGRVLARSSLRAQGLYSVQAGHQNGQRAGGCRACATFADKSGSRMSGAESATEFLHRYREACRGLWNNFLRSDDWERVKVFDEICTTLFRELVLSPLGKGDFNRVDHEPIPFLRVSPHAASVPAMIKHVRSTTTNIYWDDPVDRVSRDATMLFIDCFDWDVRSSIDMQYVRVRIAGFAAHPEVAGRDALIDARYVELHVSD